PENSIPTFRRVQFTPDLLPSDITGVNIFDTERNTFEFRAGPIFAYTVLADEINRTSPKVQSALLEAMAEKQVTVDNTTYPLDALFFVIATQNPLDLAGTYPLPTAQLDRFLFKIRMRHISRDAELSVLDPYPAPREDKVRQLDPVSRGEVLMARRVCRESVAIAPAIKECLVDIARATRDDGQVMAGVSTRALMFAMPALQARAMFHRRDYVSAEDVRQLVPYIFAHRIELVPGAEEAHEIVRQCSAAPLEALSRRSMAAS
ncbi:MAG: AAA family ATPase, partial [Myxococcota bacterium]